MTIADATLSRPALEAPIADLRATGIRTSLFQACAIAVDPRTPFRTYVFQLQAVRTGPGDVEDLRVHRFAVNETSDRHSVTAYLLEYVDTMTVVRGGHAQSMHVRISAAGNPYLWVALEDYDKAGKTVGRSLYRIRYRGFKPNTILTNGHTVQRGDRDVQRVYTGPGTVDAVGCPDWTIVLRRPGRDSDVYEWHQERDLLRRQKDYRGTLRPAPPYALRLPHGTDDHYQTSLAQGRWNAEKRRVYRVRGADRVYVVDSRTPSLEADLSKLAQGVFGSGANVEPEGAFTLDGLLHVAVQSGPVAERRVAYLPLKW